MTAVATARALVAGARTVVVLTGAGISTDSGIPDFRGPQGVWTKNPAAERMATLDHYLDDPEVRRASWRSRLTSPMWDAEPNVGHLALAHLEATAQLDTLVTQNVDGLHQKAGTSEDRIVEIHGTARWTVCWSCGDRVPMEQVLDRVRGGEEDPSCRHRVDGHPCGGILKSATISFGQSLVREDLERAELAALRSDLLLAVGSSLTVYPAAGMVPIAKRAAARLVIVNAGPTPFDDAADAVINAPIADVLPVLVGLPS